MAIPQTNIKRLLAYSSIGQVGFLLVGLAALSPLASNAIMLHLIGYAFTNMAVFVGVIAFFNMTGKEEIADFAGLADRHPFIAASIAIGMFSLAGLPIFAGFVTKFYLFIAAANEGLLWLASIAVVYSVVSLYYYLMVIRQMYIQPAASQVEDEHGLPSPAGASLDAPDEGVEQETGSPSRLIIAVLAVMVIGSIFVGVYPFPIVEALDAATAAILP